jgi:hypothetical protein
MSRFQDLLYLSGAIAPVGDAEYGDGENSEAFPGHSRPAARCHDLPEHGAGEGQRLSGVPQAFRRLGSTLLRTKIPRAYLLTFSVIGLHWF